MDNSCIWITSIKNCNNSNILELISTISLIICIAFFIFGFNTINLNSKIYNINEIGTIYIFATHFLRIIYILFLKLNINKIIILIIENIPWILLSFIFLIILITIYKLIQNKNNIIKLSIKNILIWLILSIISDYYFEKKEFWSYIFLYME